MTRSLPVIDIEPLRRMSDAAEIEAAARQIDAACREFGFFYATGHGIAPATISDLSPPLNRCRSNADRPQARRAGTKSISMQKWHLWRLSDR